MCCLTSYLPLTHPGAEDASCTEKTADCLLAYPNSLWHGRKVVPLQKDDTWEVSYESTACWDCGDFLFCPPKEPGRKYWEERNNYSDPHAICNSGTAIFGFLIVSPVYFAIVELPALLLSSIGMPMKSSVLESSKKAAIYNQLMQTYLKLEELLARKEIIVNEIDQNTKSIEYEGNLLKVGQESKASLEQIQAKFKDRKDSKEITGLLGNIDSKQFNYNSLQNKSKQLQRELDFFNLRITESEQKIKEEQVAYNGAID